MRKIITLLTVIAIIYFTAIMAVPKFMPAAAQEPQSEEYCQTWEEFLESGIKIEYDDTPTIIDDTNN